MPTIRLRRKRVPCHVSWRSSRSHTHSYSHAFPATKNKRTSIYASALSHTLRCLSTAIMRSVYAYVSTIMTITSSISPLKFVTRTSVFHTQNSAILLLRFLASFLVTLLQRNLSEKMRLFEFAAIRRLVNIPPAIPLRFYYHACYHMSVEDIVLADVIERWSIRPAKHLLLSIPPDVSHGFMHFVWPKAEEVKQIQFTAKSRRPKTITVDDTCSLWRSSTGVFWIRDDTGDLRRRLCIIGPTSTGGSCGYEATKLA